MGLGRVLVADADPRQRRMTAIVFRLAGYDVSETGQGINVLMDGRRGAFDVVVTESRLLDGDGIDLTRALRGQDETKALPILVLSGELERQAEVEAVLGPNGFLAKPATPSDLTDRIALLLGRDSTQAAASA